MRSAFRILCVVAIITLALSANAANKSSDKPISPTEDLMREHAVISRLLLIFDDTSRRLSTGGGVSPRVITQSCDIIRRFMQDYHEKNEENYIFPTLKKGALAETIKTLIQQHEAGHGLIDQIRAIAPKAAQDPTVRARLAGLMRSFNRMYTPHKAREGSVVFPAFYKMTSTARLKKPGEAFEDREHKLFGQNGFEHIVDQVAGIEKSLGIYNLSQFTVQQ